MPKEGLEPSHPKAQEPKSCVSTSSTTGARWVTLPTAPIRLGRLLTPVSGRGYGADMTPSSRRARPALAALARAMDPWLAALAALVARIAAFLRAGGHGVV